MHIRIMVSCINLLAMHVGYPTAFKCFVTIMCTVQLEALLHMVKIALINASDYLVQWLHIFVVIVTIVIITNFQTAAIKYN